MDQVPNGSNSNGKQALVDATPLSNGFHEPTLEELERELPMVHDGQVPLGELVSRMAQSIYAELTELADTMPNMSDALRKRTLAEWVVKTKRQVVKLYAVVKWSRDAGVVQKAMNITAFLMDQNRQFEEAIHGLTYARESLDPARLRNHDLLTSLDVLTTGSYRRLPTAIKKVIVPPTPLTDEQVAKTLSDIEHVIRYRLRMTEVIPPEMSKYRIADGQVFFTAPNIFETSLSLRGAKKDDGWFFVDVNFLFTVGGDATGMEDFPTRPSGMLKRHIADEADARLAFYLPLPEEQPPPPGVEVPPRPQLPEGVVDTPLVRLFNFLQMMSMSYQLEILWYQAERLRSLGWADYLTVEMINNRQMLKISYWIRKPPPAIPGRPPPQSQSRTKLPNLGGTLTISIVPKPPTTPTSSTGCGIHPPSRPAKARVLAEIQERAKLGPNNRPSDLVEDLRFEVKWEPQRGALGVVLPPEETRVASDEFVIDSNNLDVESLLRKVIGKHTKAVLTAYQVQLQRGPHRGVFSSPGVVTLATHDRSLALQVHLCADEMAYLTIDSRTGRLHLRGAGDLAATAGRNTGYAAMSDRLNESPQWLSEALVRLRLITITDLAEQKANYLGLQSYRRRNLSSEELKKFGPDARGMLFIQLSNYPNHYLVLVITDEDFRYALISVKVLTETTFADMVLEDIGWLDVRRIHGDEVAVTQRPAEKAVEPSIGQKRKRDTRDEAAQDVPEERRSSSFRLEAQVLRELYTYCCARVAYTKVEQQFKLRGIPYTHVSASGASLPAELGHLRSPLTRSIPALCVQSSDILAGVPAADAAMPNIRVIPLNWWSDDRAQVVTCVKLKYVQEPVGKRAGSSAVIRPSKRIIYDKTEAIVSFLSENVDTCVTEFLEEWARVSKMVVIAREVAQMATERQWRDVQLLSFDLQTVEFAYAGDYIVSITCTDQLSPTGGTYNLRFSRRPPENLMTLDVPDFERARTLHNPHEDVEPFLRNILRHGALASSLQRLVGLLRDTLPIVVEMDDIRESAEKAGQSVDTFPKAAGWFRVLFGDLRHALDFRLMTDGRVLVLDGSHSLFNIDDTASQAPSHPAVSFPRDRLSVLQPIPDFNAVVTDALKEAAVHMAGKRVVRMDIGVICEAAAVRGLGRILYECSLRRVNHLSR